MKFIRIAAVLCLAWAPAVHAEDTAILQNQIQALTESVRELKLVVERQQTQINELRSVSVPKPSVGQAAPVSASASALPGSATAGKWNPNIGLIADVVATLDSGRSDEEGADRVSVRELEIVFDSYVDPYSKLDATVAFSDFEEASLHEAYLTRFGLPFDMTARVGRFKPKVGKALKAHRDTLETVDEPLVIRRWFGLEGLNKTGVDLTKPLDLPFDSAHEMTVGVIEGGAGEGGNVFGTTRRRPTYYSHLKNFWDIGETTSFEAGASHMIGSKEEDADFETNVGALDFTLIHLYGPDQRLKLQNEVFVVHRDEAVDDETIGADTNVWGAYALADVRFHKQWSTGMRVDYAELIDNAATNPDDAEFGYTAYVTFYQTEFARWRLQYNRLELATGDDDNQILLQGIFAIGEHKHKLE